STSRAVTVAPVTAAAIPRRTTSTSGSSGTSGPGRLARELGPGLERGRHLRLLLARTLAADLCPANRHHRGEHARVIRARARDRVIGDLKSVRGRQLLKRG